MTVFGISQGPTLVFWEQVELVKLTSLSSATCYLRKKIAGVSRQFF